MFSSSSSFSPVQYPNQTILASTFTDTQNPSSIQENHSPPFLYFPEPFLDDHGDFLVSEFLSQQQQQQQQVSGSDITLAAESPEISNPAASNKATRINNKKSNRKGTKQPIPRRRTGKKDRHSKIYTAQGPRDRRMRLSLQIARKFFDLQDMLGFDKASKTIEWLFTKSKTAIKELTDSLPRVKKSSNSAGGKSVSSTSESEVVSGMKLMQDNRDKRGIVAEGDDSFVSTPKGKKNKKSRKTAFNPFARESRDKARARARERTRERMKIKGLNLSKLSSQANPNNLEELASSSHLENGENLGSGSLEQNSPVKVVGEEEESSTHFLQQQMDSVSIIDKFLGITSAPRSSSIFDYSHTLVVPSGANLDDELPGFPVNWDMNNARFQHRYNAIPNMKMSTGNVHLQNPNGIFVTTPNTQEQRTSSKFSNTSNPQEQNLSTIFMTTALNTQEENPSSVFMNISNPNEQNISNLVTTTDTGLLFPRIENQFSCSSIVGNKYGRLY